MKITKRNFVNPLATMNLWIIPTWAYTMQKLGGVQFNEYEWVWWIGIPSLIILWFFINFKIESYE